jgi:deoxyribodipyrimidine photo-lyase
VRALVWLRADLRTDDNRALAAAAERADRGVVAVFVCCPAQWRRHDWSDARVDFLLRTLRQLSRGLREIGIPLLVREATDFSEVPEVLRSLARKHSCDALFYNREYEVNERRRDEAVARSWEEAGQEVFAFHDQTILPPDAVSTADGGFYTVFTPFRRSWEGRLEATGGPEVMPPPEPLGELVCSPSRVPDRVEGFTAFEAAAGWPAGEGAAQARLERFVEERVEEYAGRRDLPGVEGGSRLSPYLAVGSLSPRRCLAAALAANRGRLEGGRTGVVAWIRELVWREFYRHVLVGYPRVSKGRAFREEVDARVPWRYDESDFERWRTGRTGIPLVDAGMRQLLGEAWMHNRVRMVTAMVLTKDLLIDWRWGERHFMRHLVDGDLASNNGGWQWSASTGTDAAPYFRIFNPWIQGRRYDPEGTYVKRWVPELAGVPAGDLHHPEKLAAQRRERLDYPEPLVDHAEARERALEAFRRG